MLKKAMLIGMCSLALSQAGPVSAEIVRQGASLKETIDCHNEEVRVEGADNQLELLGDCPRLTVKGASHVIRVERVGVIRFDGASNKVFWRESLGGRSPKVENAGAGNEVIRIEEEQREPHRGPEMTGGPEGGAGELEEGPKYEITVNGNDKRRTFACRGERVWVNGNGNRVNLRGMCREVRVSGNSNEVRIEAVEAIAVSGNDNRVFWRKGPGRGRPAIREEGHGNRVMRAKH